MVRDAYFDPEARISDHSGEEHLPPELRGMDDLHMMGRHALNESPWAGVDEVEHNLTLRNMQEAINNRRLG